MKNFLASAFLPSVLTGNCFGQGIFESYVEPEPQGPGTYTPRDGTTQSGKLRFRARTASMLFVDKKLKFPASQVRSFTIDGHTLVAQGNFDFSYGMHSYRTQDAFIEFFDTAGTIQLGIYRTTEPIGSSTLSFATFVLRRRGEKFFVIGPNGFKTGGRGSRERLTAGLARWPILHKG